MSTSIRIGRNPENDIVLNSSYVSGFHAEILRSDVGSYLFVDHSRNGTIINGFMVHNQSVNVNYGDNILLAGHEALDWSRVQNTIPSSSSFNNNVFNQDFSRQSNNQYKPQTSKIGFKDAIRICLKEKYASFQGRATRSEYWYFVLFYAIVIFAVSLISGILGALFSEGDVSTVVGVMVILLALVALGFILPGISVLVRRLHDTGRSGWYYWLCLIPWIGGIIIFIFCCLESQRRDNEYGTYVR